MPETTPEAARVARASAKALAGEHGARIVADVERELHAGAEDSEPDQYLDPVSLGALIVSAATFAWQVYTDSRDRGKKPDSTTLARSVRIELEDHSTEITAGTEHVITVVVQETLHRGDQP